MRFAAAIDGELRRYLERLAGDETLSAAEVNRRVGERAESLHLPRPSYAGVRLLVRDLRLGYREPSWGSVLLDVGFRVRPVSALEDKAAGLIDKHLPEDYGLRNERR